jgi:hypothetical protein
MVQRSNPAGRSDLDLRELTEITEQTASRIADLSEAAITQLAEINASIQEELEVLREVASRLEDGSAQRPINSRPSSPGARLLAVQLVAAGADPKRIEQRLRDDFSIADPSKILDSLAGSDSEGSAD